MAEQFEDVTLNKILNKVVRSDTQNTTFGAFSLLRVKGHVCVPHVNDVIPSFLAEAYGSMYSIHIG